MLNFLIRIIYITLAIIAVIGLIKFYTPFNENDYRRIVDKGEIVAGIRTGPISYYEVKTEKIGYTYDVLQELSKFLNLDLKVIALDNTASALQMLNEREIDILADMGILNNVHLNYSHTQADYYLVYNSDFLKKPTNHQSISDHSINIIDSPKIIRGLGQFFNKSNIDLIIMNEKNIDEILHLLVEGKIKYTVLSSDELTFYKVNFPEIEIAYKIATDVKYNWALPNNTSHHFPNELSNFFTDMLKKNKLKYIKQRNLNGDAKYSFVGSKNFIRDLANIFPLYEFYFKSYSKKYKHDWRLLASVGYQESRWNKDAISYTGVKGIMMLTKNTSIDMKIDDRTDPKDSIYGGAKYLRKMLDKIPDQINQEDKIWYAVAAYNIGFGHVIDAIDMAKRDNKIISDWESLKPYLLKLSQSKYYKKTKYGYARGWETVKYVQNIRQYYDILVFLDSQDNVINNKEIDDKIPSTL